MCVNVSQENGRAPSLPASSICGLRRALNIADVFKFNPSTDLFTITNNQNTGGINIDGNNGRLYFNGIRALEGNSSGLMTVGEGMTTINIPSNTGIGTASPTSGKLHVHGGN